MAAPSILCRRFAIPMRMAMNRDTKLRRCLIDDAVLLVRSRGGELITRTAGPLEALPRQRVTFIGKVRFCLRFPTCNTVNRAVILGDSVLNEPFFSGESHVGSEVRSVSLFDWPGHAVLPDEQPAAAVGR